mgnify:CR=1 FL=1
MNSDIQRKTINRFLKGKNKKDIDAFCLYQWVDRCHFEGWWDDAIALGSHITPNSLTQDYQKRVEFLLNQCRNKVKERKDNFIEIGNSQDTKVFPIPKVFLDKVEELGLELENRGEKRIKLKYLKKRLLFLEKITFDACTFYFLDRSYESLQKCLDQYGFGYVVSNMRKTKNEDERRPRIKMLWNDATSLLPILFTNEYLNTIEKKMEEKGKKLFFTIKWNNFGHRIGSQAAKIDDLLLEGASLVKISSTIGSTIGRVKSHIRHLENEKKIKVTKSGSIYKILAENIPEKSILNIQSSNRKIIQQNFWNAFKDFALENDSILKIKNVYPVHWLDSHFGSSQCHICMTINIKRKRMTCELYINDSKQLFRKLLEARDIIEQELRESLQWNELPDKKASRIKLIREADVTIQENWQEYFTWLMKNAESFQDVFSKYL